MKYREKIDNKYYGGPSYYIRKCLHNKTFSIIYSVLLIISYGLLFLSIQANTIIKVTSNFNISDYYVVIILVITVIMIMKKGLSILNLIEYLL